VSSTAVIEAGRPRGEGTRAPVGGGVAQLRLDAEELVVLGDAVGAGRGTRLDLPAVRGHGKSAIVTSSVSPDRCDITEVYAARVAMPTVSSVSVRVPIWLTLMRMELATAASIPRCSRSTFVTNRSSPTSCTEPERRCVTRLQPSQSSSAMPSSMDTIG